MYNILIACDSGYYNKWGVNCIKSIKHYTPWVNITVVIVNPTNIEELTGIRYVYDNREFVSEESKIGYYQCLRFLKVPELFKDDELVLTLDCDTICTREFTPTDFINVTKTVHVLKHHKENRWLAGFVSYGKDNFRHRFKDALMQKPIDEWAHGWDQEVLNNLQPEYKYSPINIGTWVSFGKGIGTFLTLKGTQKESPKYLPNYLEKMEKISGKYWQGSKHN